MMLQATGDWVTFSTGTTVTYRWLFGGTASPIAGWRCLPPPRTLTTVACAVTLTSQPRCLAGQSCTWQSRLREGGGGGVEEEEEEEEEGGR